MSYQTNYSAIMHISTVSRNFNVVELSTVMARMKENVKPTAFVQTIQDYFTRTQRGLSIRVRTAEQLLKQMEKQIILQESSLKIKLI